MPGGDVDKRDLMLAFVAITFLAYGEFDALRAVSGSQSHPAGAATAAAIAAGFAGVLAGALGRRTDDPPAGEDA
jgi:hypothetical protein